MAGSKRGQRRNNRETGSYYERMAGVYLTEKGYEISGEKEYDINDYALPDYGLVEKVNVTGRDKPVDVYSFLGNTHAGDIKTLSKSDDKISYFPLFTSYGCGNNCTFCDADKKLQRYSFDNVKKMIKRYCLLYTSPSPRD